VLLVVLSFDSDVQERPQICYSHRATNCFTAWLLASVLDWAKLDVANVMKPDGPWDLHQSGAGYFRPTEQQHLWQ